MTYNLKRALTLSLALYAATFIVALICGIASGQDMSSMSTVSDSFWYVGMVSAALLAALFTFWYFKNKQITPSPKSGLLFGLTTIALSTALDGILFTLGNTQGANVDLLEYYNDFRFWIIVLLVLAVSTLVGKMKGDKKV